MNKLYKMFLVLLLILVLIIMYIVYKYFITKRKPKNFISVCKKDIGKFSNYTVLGINEKKKQLIFLITKVKNVLFIDKNHQLDFLNINIDTLSKLNEKPKMIIIDSQNELFNTNKAGLEKVGYKIYKLNLKKINWDILEIIHERLFYLKDLTENIDNRKGKYYLKDEVFLSYKNIRERLQKVKEEIIELIKKIIMVMFKYENDNKSLLTTCLFLSVIERELYYNTFDKLTTYNILLYLIKNQYKTINSIKTSLARKKYGIFETKNLLHNCKLTDDDLKIVYEQMTSLIKNLDSEMEKEIKIKQLINESYTLFVEDYDLNHLKLFLACLHQETKVNDTYLIIDKEPLFLEDNYEKFSIIMLVNKILSVNAYNYFQVKVYKGISDVENKKELLMIYDNKTNKNSSNNYLEIFKFFRIMNKLNNKNNNILIIDNKGESTVTEFKNEDYQLQLTCNRDNERKNNNEGDMENVFK